MIDINELRRLAQEATPGPWKMLPVGDGRQKFAVADSEFLSILTVTDEGGATFGTVYDDADARFIAAANPATISELLGRLEVAEKEAESWKGLAQQFGNEADALRAAVRHEADCVEATKAEIVTLSARIEAMERQGPGFRERCTPSAPTGCSNRFPLYALPGAQPAPSFADAYQGAMEEVAIWKKRALEAEDLNRKFIAGINGPTHMGEPVQNVPSVPAVPTKSLKPVIDWLRNGCDPMRAADELELLIAAALKPEAKPCP